MSKCLTLRLLLNLESAVYEKHVFHRERSAFVDDVSVCKDDPLKVQPIEHYGGCTNNKKTRTDCDALVGICSIELAYLWKVGRFRSADCVHCGLLEEI